MSLLLALSLHVFGPGPFTNLGPEQANTNAIAHVWFGVACPLALQRFAGWEPWQSGLACGLAVLGRDAVLHGNTPGPEVRTDLISGLVPIVAISVLTTTF